MQATPTAIRRMIETAKATGMPDDQLRNFLSVGYVPQQKQMAFHAAARLCDLDGGPDEIGFGGARGPGKSHAIMAQLALDDCRRLPGLKALYLRKVGKQAREQFEDLRRSVLKAVPHKYNRQEGVVYLWDESRIFIGSFKDESDVDNYLGIEYDLVAIEECTALTLTKYRALRDSNRTSKTGWRPRIYNSTNPGNVGHAWYKAKFINPARLGQEEFTRFIFSTVDDNAFIDRDYKRKLEENTGWKLKAYRFGDWDIAAGQFFTTWRADVHVIKPITQRYGWRYWGALDYGFTHPTAAYLLGQDGDGSIYAIDEYRQSKQLVPTNAEAIKAMLERNGLRQPDLHTFVAGADCFAQRGDSSGTIAEQYAAAGIPLTRANTDRVNGAAEVLSRLGDQAQGVRPRLFVFDRCQALIDCLPTLEHDPGRPEDVLKADVDEDGNGGDDAYDALRYGVMAVQSSQSYAMKYT